MYKVNNNIVKSISSATFAIIILSFMANIVFNLIPYLIEIIDNFTVIIKSERIINYIRIIIENWILIILIVLFIIYIVSEKLYKASFMPRFLSKLKYEVGIRILWNLILLIIFVPLISAIIVSLLRIKFESSSSNDTNISNIINLMTVLLTYILVIFICEYKNIKNISYFGKLIYFLSRNSFHMVILLTVLIMYIIFIKSTGISLIYNILLNILFTIIFTLVYKNLFIKNFFTVYNKIFNDKKAYINTYINSKSQLNKAKFLCDIDFKNNKIKDYIDQSSIFQLNLFGGIESDENQYENKELKEKSDDLIIILPTFDKKYLSKKHYYKIDDYIDIESEGRYYIQFIYEVTFKIINSEVIPNYDELYIEKIKKVNKSTESKNNHKKNKYYKELDLKEKLNLLNLNSRFKFPLKINNINEKEQLEESEIEKAGIEYTKEYDDIRSTILLNGEFGVGKTSYLANDIFINKKKSVFISMFEDNSNDYIYSILKKVNKEEKSYPKKIKEGLFVRITSIFKNLNVLVYLFVIYVGILKTLEELNKINIVNNINDIVYNFFREIFKIFIYNADLNECIYKLMILVVALIVSIYLVPHIIKMFKNTNNFIDYFLDLIVSIVIENNMILVFEDIDRLNVNEIEELFRTISALNSKFYKSDSSNQIRMILTYDKKKIKEILLEENGNDTRENYNKELEDKNKYKELEDKIIYKEYELEASKIFLTSLIDILDRFEKNQKEKDRKMIMNLKEKIEEYKDNNKIISLREVKKYIKQILDEILK
ncbi:hypothetical protein ACKA04_07770 [Helcococcus kunzii]|uniref:hypothetical protein n=1 Tax=Helcococcus kunzii TaxID=40091 RepID=UPI0038A90B87